MIGTSVTKELRDRHIFMLTITVDFKEFQYFSSKTSFFKNEKWNTVFYVKTQKFHTKLPYQKSKLGQIECRVQNGPITKNGRSFVTQLLCCFEKFISV